MSEVVRTHVNTEAEKITIEKLGEGHGFAGDYLLVIHDDPPPKGTFATAPTLLDTPTVDWLIERLTEIKQGQLAAL